MSDVAIVIEAVQFTPQSDAVHVQWSARDPSSVPFSGTQIHHTTQPALMARSVISDTWGDEEIETDLIDALSAAGVAAVIVQREAPQPDVANALTRFEQAAQDAVRESDA